MSAARVVLVTGANKGIGYAIAKNLATNPDYNNLNLHVIIGSRDAKNAEVAVESLQKEGAKNVSYVVLDVTDDKSVQDAAEEIKAKHGGLDVLVNNAGMAFKGSAFDENVARTTIGTNYFGMLRVNNAFFPLLRENSRVVNISSMVSSRSLKNMSQEKRDRFLAPDLTVDELSALMNEFIDDVKNNVSDQKGWPHSTYGVSKAGVSMLTRIQARDSKIPGVKINACCPGWVKTDMAGPNAPLTPDQGALTPSLLATIGDDGPTGTMWENQKQTYWIVD
jgi:carbonyl reductase 1